MIYLQNGGSNNSNNNVSWSLSLPLFARKQYLFVIHPYQNLEFLVCQSIQILGFKSRCKHLVKVEVIYPNFLNTFQLKTSNTLCPMLQKPLLDPDLDQDKIVTKNKHTDNKFIERKNINSFMEVMSIVKIPSLAYYDRAH